MTACGTTGEPSAEPSPMFAIRRNTVGMQFQRCGAPMMQAFGYRYYLYRLGRIRPVDAMTERVRTALEV